jgi:hypothetical protein
MEVSIHTKKKESSNTEVDVRTSFMDLIVVTCVVLSATDDYLIGMIGIL